MKVGSKRLLLLLMVSAVPLVYASPTSTLQEAPSNVPQSQVVTAPVPILEEKTVPEEVEPFFIGVASWYSETDAFINKHTANGEIFDDTKMTCATWDFPFRTRLRVTNIDNGRSVTVVVNDRGPAKRLGRLIDLTRAAFEKIASTRTGIIRVIVDPLPD